MDNQDYHKDTTHLSKSKLDIIHESPYTYWDTYLNPIKPWEDKDTEATLLGSAMHTMVLEPEKFDSQYLKPKNKIDRRTSVGKMEWVTLTQQAEEERKKIISIEIYDKVSFMRDAARSHPVIKSLLDAPGVVEHIYKWTDPETGLPCKARADKITNDLFIIDLKSARSIFPVWFSKACDERRYHVQDAFYSDGFYHAYNKQVQGFIFIAISSEPPFMVKAYVLDAESKNLGRAAYSIDLITAKACIESGNWPVYPGDNGKISEISLPKYAFQKPII